MAPLDFIATANSTTDASSYTFTGVSLGAADADRLVLVHAGARASSARTITGMTIGGITATELRDSSADQTNGSWYIAAVPTGATGDIVVTYSGTMVRCNIAVFRLVGVDPTPVDVDSHGIAGSSSAARTVTMTSVAGGFVAGAVVGSGASVTFTWSGVTEDYDFSYEASGNRASGGHGTTAGSSVTVTATPSGSILDGILVAITFQPSASPPVDASGSAASVSDATGAATAQHPASGTVPISSTATGAATATHPASGTTASVSAASGAASARHSASGTAASVSSCSGQPTATHPVSGLIPIVSGATGAATGQDPGAPTNVSGVASSTSSASGQPTARHPVAGTIPIISGATGAASGTDPGVVSAAGVAASTSSASGQVTARHPAAGAVTVLSTLTGTAFSRHPASGTAPSVSTAFGSPIALPPGGLVIPRVFILSGATQALHLGGDTPSRILASRTPSLRLESSR